MPQQSSNHRSQNLGVRNFQPQNPINLLNLNTKRNFNQRDYSVSPDNISPQSFKEALLQRNIFRPRVNSKNKQSQQFNQQIQINNQNRVKVLLGEELPALTNQNPNFKLQNQILLSDLQIYAHQSQLYEKNEVLLQNNAACEFRQNSNSVSRNKSANNRQSKHSYRVNYSFSLNEESKSQNNSSIIFEDNKLDVEIEESKQNINQTCADLYVLKETVDRSFSDIQMGIYRTLSQQIKIQGQISTQVYKFEQSIQKILYLKCPIKFL